MQHHSGAGKWYILDLGYPNSIHLYPLQKSELEALLTRNGFRNLQFYGNFKQEFLSGDSIPLVVKAFT